MLGKVASAPVSDLVEHTIRTSDNVLAEMLAREVAIERKAEPSFEGAAAQTLLALPQAGFDTAGAELVDGSGLSTADRVPAQLLGAVLAEAAAPAQGARDTQFLRPIVTGLPVAGGDGTLVDRFANGSPSASGRGVVRAKTGTLTGVSSLAGIVTDADGRLLVFALMSNGVEPGAGPPEARRDRRPARPLRLPLTRGRRGDVGAAPGPVAQTVPEPHPARSVGRVRLTSETSPAPASEAEIDVGLPVDWALARRTAARLVPAGPGEPRRRRRAGPQAAGRRRRRRGARARGHRDG